MIECSNRTREVHGFMFKCKAVASVELCYNKESSTYEPYCAECLKNDFHRSDINLKRYLVRELK